MSIDNEETGRKLQGSCRENVRELGMRFCTARRGQSGTTATSAESDAALKQQHKGKSFIKGTQRACSLGERPQGPWVCGRHITNAVFVCSTHAAQPGVRGEAGPVGFRGHKAGVMR